MSYLLGIDVGSTNLKAVLFGYDGKIVAKADTPTELVRPEKDHPDWAVWQPEQIWSGIAQSVRKVVTGIDASTVKGVAVTGMGMDGVPLDASGKWLYPFISWHCPRTLPQQKWWIEHVGIERQFQVGGDQIWPFNTALRLRWMKEHQPAILERTHKWVLIEDFINFMLCGEYATDFSMASTTLLFDQSTRSWNEELLKRSEIDKDLLCDPKPSGTVLGEVHKAAAELTGLKAGTPVVLGGHDYSCGCLPTGAYRPGVVLDVLGTWEMVVAALICHYCARSFRRDPLGMGLHWLTPAATGLLSRPFRTLCALGNRWRGGGLGGLGLPHILLLLSLSVRPTTLLRLLGDGGYDFESEDHREDNKGNDGLYETT